MRTIRLEAKRRVSILIAEKSYRRKFIGLFASRVGAIPVSRAMDLTKPATGKIYMPDVNDPTLIRGVGTNFEAAGFEAGGMLVLPTINGETANSEVLEIHGPEEIRLKREFKGTAAITQLTGREDVDKEGKVRDTEKSGPVDGFEGTKFKSAPKVDQSKVFNAVFDRLNLGDCVGIFPEGGSHDRTELLPLKGTLSLYYLG
jgi:glycerol-3-phosphate O-acyltransferase / dihydroxyacetone phosphate acyltransferase